MSIIFALLFGYLQFTHADLIKLEGRYLVSSRIDVASGWTEVQIPLKNSAGEQEFASYREKGWECRRVSNWGMCKGWVFAPLTPEEGARALLEVYRKGPLVIGKEKSGPELIHEGEIFKQYRMNQEVRWAGQLWPNFDAFDFGDRLIVNLRDSSQTIEQNFQVGSEGQLVMMNRFLRQIDARKTQVLWLEISLVPELRH